MLLLLLPSISRLIKIKSHISRPLSDLLPHLVLGRHVLPYSELAEEVEVRGIHQAARHQVARLIVAGGTGELVVPMSAV